MTLNVPKDDARDLTSALITKFFARLHDVRFWVVQALIALVTLLDMVLGAHGAFAGQDRSALAFLSISLYFIPVIYAGLNFGREGAIPTAAWSALLATPTIALWYSGAVVAGQVVQLLTMVALAIIIAGRVDRETLARRRAEAERSAHRLSEAKYRGLFESAGDPILVYDADGLIREANAAACTLFGKPLAGICNQSLAELLGEENAQWVLRSADEPRSAAGDLRIPIKEVKKEMNEAAAQAGEAATVERWVEPVYTAVLDASGNRLVQVLLRDVTARRQRQHGLESYARQVLQAQEDERRRIAREIHDSSVQSVVLLCRRLDALEDAAPPGLAEALNSARDVAEEIAGELRRFSRGLRPSVLDDLGLIPAVKWLVSDLTSRTNVEGRMRTEGVQRRLSAEAELCLYRITQEALRNVERHADAAQVVVTLHFDAESVSLTVDDNGRGFASEGPAPGLALSGKLGLLGMHERAWLLGGSCRVISEPGAGSHVQVSLPAPSLSSEQPQALVSAPMLR